ncbi:DUF2946 domain-containing protein [Pseudomonas sp. RIT-To-2]|uniref:DUF2946 domain-containing protein n=1 Tax=Pseudomonas sp. RIT-To-2 TaxID=3462541 RepID=UPI002413160D
MSRRAAHRPSAPRPPRATWLSLFAMLMIFIGPLVSQAMPMEHERGVAMEMPMDMPGMDMGNHHGDPALHPLWEKCGYCSLFFHTPALPTTPDPLPLAKPATVAGWVPTTRQGHARQAIFPGAMTRAPPTTHFL